MPRGIKNIQLVIHKLKLELGMLGSSSLSSACQLAPWVDTEIWELWAQPPFLAKPGSTETSWGSHTLPPARFSALNAKARCLFPDHIVRNKVLETDQECEISQVPLQTYWIKTSILTRSLGNLYVHCNLKGIALTCNTHSLASHQAAFSSYYHLSTLKKY